MDFIKLEAATKRETFTGGYEANFNPPLDDRYQCPICFLALRDPIQTKCGHRFCMCCYESAKKTSYYFKCPLDNTSANEVFQDNALRREVLSLKVDCTNKSKCSWTGELRDLEGHLKSCQYEKIECPNKCQTEVTRYDLDRHLTKCPLRIKKCHNCKILFILLVLLFALVLMLSKFYAIAIFCVFIYFFYNNLHEVVTNFC